MKILNILASGGTGGIERLCEDLSEKSKHDNYYAFLFEEGAMYERLLKKYDDKVFSCIPYKDKTSKIIKNLKDIIEKHKIDIVVVHHGGIKCNIIYLKLMKYNKNIKFVRYLHGCYDNFSWGRGKNVVVDFLADAIMKSALTKSDLIVCVSTASKESFIKRFGKFDNMIVVYNGINDVFFENVNNKIFDNKLLKFVYVGRLEYLKGLDCFIDSLNDLKDTVKFEMEIVGDGSYMRVLEKKVKDYGLQDRITFLGRKNNVKQYLDRNDIFVYPSICEEGFGISVGEAIARGCIPFVSNKGGLPEVVDYNNSLIFEDSEDMKNKIIQLSKLSKKEKKVLSDHYVSFANKFRINKVIESLDNYYQKIFEN